MTTQLYTGPITTSFAQPLRYVAVDSIGNVSVEIRQDFTLLVPVTVSVESVAVFSKVFGFASGETEGWASTTFLYTGQSFKGVVGAELVTGNMSRTVSCDAGNIAIICLNSSGASTAVNITGTENITTSIPYVYNALQTKNIAVTGGTYTITIGPVNNLYIDSITLPSSATARRLSGSRSENSEIALVSGAIRDSFSYPTTTTWTMDVSGLTPNADNTIVIAATDGATTTTAEIEVTAPYFTSMRFTDVPSCASNIVNYITEDNLAQSSVVASASISGSFYLNPVFLSSNVLSSVVGSGRLVNNVKLKSSLTSGAALVGSATRIEALSGLIVSSTSVTAPLLVQGLLQGTIFGSATCSSTLIDMQEVRLKFMSLPTVSAGKINYITADFLLAGLLQGTSTTSASLLSAIRLLGNSEFTSVVSGLLKTNLKLSGVSAGLAVVEALLDPLGSQLIAGASFGSSRLGALLATNVELQSYVLAQTSLAGWLYGRPVQATRLTISGQVIDLYYIDGSITDASVLGSVDFVAIKGSAII